MSDSEKNLFIQYLTSGNPIDKPVYVYIYSFHMPLFMMISGYFASSSIALPIKELLKKKNIQLLLPCVIWGSILTFIVFLLQQLRGNNSCLWEMYIGTIGSLNFISLFYLLLKRNPISSFLDVCSEWGKYTLSIYILQGLIWEIFMAKFIKLDNFNFLTFNFIITPLLSAFLLMICVLISKFIGKFSRLNFFLFLVQSK